MAVSLWRVEAGGLQAEQGAFAGILEPVYTHTCVKMGRFPQ